MTKICFFSDTHGLHNKVAIPPCDILVCAGDVTDNEGRASLRNFLNWLELQPAVKKVMISGNHDGAFEKWPDLARAMVKELSPSTTYLQDSGCEINGIRFWGSPVSPSFFNWYFNRDRGPAIKRHWDMIPDNTDVLITHGPPYGILDGGAETVIGGVPMGIEKLGCRDLYEAIQRVKPVVHAFGHIHMGYGTTRYIHDDGWCTTMINASCCNEQYKPVNAPWIFDYDTNRITA